MFPSEFPLRIRKLASNILQVRSKIVQWFSSLRYCSPTSILSVQFCRWKYLLKTLSNSILSEWEHAVFSSMRLFIFCLPASKWWNLHILSFDLLTFASIRKGWDFKDANAQSGAEKVTIRLPFFTEQIFTFAT